MPHATNDGDEYEDVIERSFLKSRHLWYEEPVLDTWKGNTPQILATVNSIYHQWKDQDRVPFSPSFDPLWAETASIMRDAGLPWHNNELNLPTDVDTSWPFHFKDFEQHVVITKGARVGNARPAGYICDWTETNQYGIRAIQQELRRQMPDLQPLLVAGCIEHSITESAAQLFGLEVLQLDSWKTARHVLQSAGGRPIILAATLGNSQGEIDDFDVIRAIAKEMPIYLHLDASRTFDYLTTMATSERKQLGLPRLLLRHPFKDQVDYDDDAIYAATIVAAGMNSVSPPPTVILKPADLGSTEAVNVEYVRGTDGTLAGSRDALGPLLMCLQELRFGASGMQEIYRRCRANRLVLQKALADRGVSVSAPSMSLDLIIRAPASSGSLVSDTFVATVQPSAMEKDAARLVKKLSGSPCSIAWQPPKEYPIKSELTDGVRSVVDSFRVVGKTSGGYPLNQAPYSALGPIIGHFLPLSIPSEWTRERTDEMLEARKSSFGIPSSEHHLFSAHFTTGSTMGNRVGIHNALAQHPDAYVYYSSATHYSVKKIIRDCDALTGIWRDRPHFAEIPTDDYGSMSITALVEKVLSDKVNCATRRMPYEVVLFANIGTTFVGGRDDIAGIRSALRQIDARLAYVHVDGALDLGFAPDTVTLGPPDMESRDGWPVVQGLTLSHHKAYGIMVSGEVICYNPVGTTIAPVVDARIVFETWLFQQMYSADDLLRTRQYCFDNSTRLRRSLHAIGLATRYNKGCMITLLERIPPWLVEEFHLAPEGPWVHYISMPHITPAAVDHFVASIFRVAMHFAATFRALQSPLAQVLGSDIRLTRVRYHDTPLFEQVAAMRKQPIDLDAFIRKYIYSAISYAAIGPDGVPRAVFLAEASRQRTLMPGPVLVHPSFKNEHRLLQNIGQHGFSYIAKRMDLVVSRSEVKCTESRKRRYSEPTHERPRVHASA